MTHEGSRAGRRESQPSPGPAPLLDIGGDVGAVVVRLPADTPTGELMACPRGSPAAHFHTGVHRRADRHGEAWVAVFPEVTAGAYSLMLDGAEGTAFDVVGGEVTTIEVADPR